MGMRSSSSWVKVLLKRITQDVRKLADEAKRLSLELAAV
jgi:hypothetical protein